MRILIVKLSSLGDVIHSFPAIQDLRRQLPLAQIDWVVERGFAPLVSRCEGVSRVIPCELRRWRRAPLAAETRAQWREFRENLQAAAYDRVLDLHGLSKSAWVAWMARLAPGGQRIAMANRTDGSSYEAPTRWVAHRALPLAPHVHALVRSRLLCAQAFGYVLPPLVHGLRARCADGPEPASGEVLLVHGTSRADKCWPDAHWLALGQRLLAQGHRLALAHGSPEEELRSVALAQELGAGAKVWPRMPLGELADRMSVCAGVIGVDSGLSHLAVALDRPHVQIYNFDTAWRTGPLTDPGQPVRQSAVFASPTPSVDAVWSAWCRVRAASGVDPALRVEVGA